MAELKEAECTPHSALRTPHCILPLLICLVQFCLLAHLARQHPYGTYSTETDFYHFFAPDAERLASGQFPRNTYQGPGYPATLAVLSKFGGGADFFTVGKWLSVACAVLVGWLTFVLFARLWGYWVGVGAQLLVVVSGEFPQFSISATTDVFFLLLCLATLVVFISGRLRVHWRVALAAMLVSLSYLTRYNGLFLVATCLVGLLFLNLFGLSWRARLQQATLFVGVFVIVALPWFYYNAKHHGSPLYNTNYLNIATEFYPELVKGKVNQDGTRALEDRFRSFGDVLRYEPTRLPRRYPGNLWESLRNIVRTTLLNQWVAWAALGGLILVLLERRSKAALVLLSAGALYLLLMALSHWETRYYFFLMALSAGLAVYFVVHLFELARARGRLRHAAFALIPALLVGALFTASLAQSRKDVQEFLESHPSEIIAARDYLQSVGECNAEAHKRIIARKPHIAYFCRAEWLFFPQVKSLDELRAWIATNPADYLLVSQRELKERKELKQLGQPNKAPAWLQPVWSQGKPLAVLYRPVINSATVNSAAPNQE